MFLGRGGHCVRDTHLSQIIGTIGRPPLIVIGHIWHVGERDRDRERERGTGGVEWGLAFSLYIFFGKSVAWSAFITQRFDYYHLQSPRTHWALTAQGKGHTKSRLDVDHVLVIANDNKVTLEFLSRCFIVEEEDCFVTAVLLEWMKATTISLCVVVIILT